jgi:hypothetical protein
VLSIQSMVENSVLRVDLVENGVGITLSTCCEDYDFPFFRYFLEKCQGVRSDIEINGHEGVIHLNFQT